METLGLLIVGVGAVSCMYEALTAMARAGELDEWARGRQTRRGTGKRRTKAEGGTKILVA